MEGRTELRINKEHKKNVLYLMQRDHRLQNNYSMQLAYNLSYSSKSALFIGCNIQKIKKNTRQHAFIIEGLIELDQDLNEKCLKLYIISNLDEFIRDFDVDCIVTEFSPLNEAIEYQKEIEKLDVAFYICDSHNIVPCKKLESFCKTSKGVKSRLYKFWNTYFVEQKKLEKHEINSKQKENKGKKNNNSNYCIISDYKLKNTVNDTEFKGGASNGFKTLELFLNSKFNNFKKLRNKPDEDCNTNLSPWIHTGQLSVIDIIQKTMEKYSLEDENFEILLNEIFVWKETAEHFCYYNNYDKVEGALDWAQTSLKEHTKDKREKTYTYAQLENAQTDNEEWNAAQKEMVIRGRMHGYAKIYWSKTLLFLTKNPEIALNYAIKLNDQYSIDANDPVEYAWIMYSICGVMDQGWKERNIIGKIRCINSLKGKKYVKRWIECDLPKKNSKLN